MILVAEDLNSMFHALRMMLEQACIDLHVNHTIVRCTREDEIETYLVDCEDSAAPLLLVFDNIMDLPGGRSKLRDLIHSLWKAPPGTWRSRVPIIIFVDRTEDFRLPHRSHSAVIDRIPRAGVNNRLELRTAMRSALRALVEGA
jgi:hypothetical protein